MKKPYFLIQNNIFVLVSLLLTFCFKYPVFALANKTSTEKRIEPSQVLEHQVKDIAKLITVRIFTDKKDNHGSGVIVDKQVTKNSPLSVYLILTSSHIFNDNKRIYVKTHDGRTHLAYVHPDKNIFSVSQKTDLQLIWFASNHNYTQAKINDALIIDPNTKTFISGFPCKKNEKEDFCNSVSEEIITTIASHIYKPSKILNDGYNLGYNADLQEGSSGGSVLNSKSELVAINGRRMNNSSSIQYNFRDQKQPTEDEIAKMRQYSWGIPISAYTEIKNKLSKDIPITILTKNENEIYVDLNAQIALINSKIESNNQNASNRDKYYIIAIIAFCIMCFFSAVWTAKNIIDSGKVKDRNINTINHNLETIIAQLTNKDTQSMAKLIQLEEKITQLKNKNAQLKLQLTKTQENPNQI